MHLYSALFNKYTYKYDTWEFPIFVIDVLLVSNIIFPVERELMTHFKNMYSSRCVYFQANFYIINALVDNGIFND